MACKANSYINAEIYSVNTPRAQKQINYIVISKIAIPKALRYATSNTMNMYLYVPIFHPF